MAPSSSAAVSPEYFNATNSTELRITCIVFLILNTIFVALRYVARYYHQNGIPRYYHQNGIPSLGWDDVFIWLGWIFCQAVAIGGITKSRNSFNNSFHIS